MAGHEGAETGNTDDLTALDPVLVIGAGYIGLPYAAMLARGCFECGPTHVLLCDRSEERIGSILEALDLGQDPLAEPGLQQTIKQAGGRLNLWRSGALEALEALAREQRRPRAIVVAVGTPALPGGGGLDLQPITDLVSEICANAALFTSGEPIPIVVRSTITPSKAEHLQTIVAGADGAFALYVIPEFLQEGHAIEGLSRPDRVVVGGPSRRSCEIMASFFSSGHARLFTMGPAEASLVKLTSNALLSLKIEVAAMVADYIEESTHGGDAVRVLEAVGADPRIGFGALRVGLGPMGPCLPKDWSAWLSELGAVIPQARLEWPPERHPRHEWPSAPVAFKRSGLVLAIGIGFKPDSPDWRNGLVLKLMRAECFRSLSVTIWDERLSPMELIAANRDSKEIGGPLVLGPDHPIPDVTGGVVYLFCAPPADWLMEARDMLFIDPFSLLNKRQADRLSENGCRLIRRGRKP